MKPFETIKAKAAYLPESNIDTDIIYPARYLLIPERQGLGRYAFADRRGKNTGSWDFSSVEILVTGENFGCGSSREQAVWCLLDLGVRVIIAPSFGEIFHNNCFKNGVLPIRLPPEPYRAVASAASSGRPIEVDLGSCTITIDGAGLPFEIDAGRRAALIAGLDEIDLILTRLGSKIDDYELSRKRQAPWTFFYDEGQK